MATEESVNKAEKEKAERRDWSRHHRGNKLNYFVVLLTIDIHIYNILTFSNHIKIIYIYIYIYIIF